MAANTNPVFPLTPYCKSASLAAVTACATRAPIATADLATNNLVELVGTSTNGRKIDRIQVQACSSSITAATAAQLVQLWEWDGTTAWLIDEIVVTSLTPSVSAVSYATSKSYTNLVLPSTHKLYVSTTVTTTASTTALQVTAFGGDY